LVTVAGLLAGVFSGDVHMAGGMLVHQLSVLIVITNDMRPVADAEGGPLPMQASPAARVSRTEVTVDHYDLCRAIGAGDLHKVHKVRQ
jgi:hypothetical protein